MARPQGRATKPITARIRCSVLESLGFVSSIMALLIDLRLSGHGGILRWPDFNIAPAGVADMINKKAAGARRLLFLKR